MSLPTVCPEDQSCGRALNFSFCDAVGHHTSVVAHVRGLHLGNVEVSRLLRDEPSIVLLDKVGVLIENPGVSEVWKKKTRVPNRPRSDSQKAN